MARKGRPSWGYWFFYLTFIQLYNGAERKVQHYFAMETSVENRLTLTPLDKQGGASNPGLNRRLFVPDIRRVWEQCMLDSHVLHLGLLVGSWNRF
jgi:hypothetical protein